MFYRGEHEQILFQTSQILQLNAGNMALNLTAYEMKFATFKPEINFGTSSLALQ